MLSNFVVVHCGRFIYLFLCVVPLHPQKCSTSEDALLPLGGVGYVRSQDCECSSGCDRSTRDAVTGHYMWITSSEGGQPPHRLLGLPSYQSLHLHQNNRSSDRTMWIHHRPKTPRNVRLLVVTDLCINGGHSIKR